MIRIYFIFLHSFFLSERLQEVAAERWSRTKRDCIVCLALLLFLLFINFHSPLSTGACDCGAKGEQNKERERRRRVRERDREKEGQSTAVKNIVYSLIKKKSHMVIWINIELKRSMSFISNHIGFQYILSAQHKTNLALSLQPPDKTNQHVHEQKKSASKPRCCWGRGH